MAKYDDFGRPIYETAEEYNKAHKSGVCPRTYDSPVGENYQTTTRKETHRHQSATQRHANQTGSKKAKSLVVGIASFFLVFNIVLVLTIIGSIGFSIDSDFEVNEENWFDTEIKVDYYEEYIGDDATPLPSGFETFSYNGKTYTLPESYEQLVDEGFMEEGYDFYIDNPVVFDEAVTVPDFVFGERLTFESTYEDLEAYFGTPYYHCEDHSDPECLYDRYEWCYNGENESHYVSVTFWDGVISDVEIDKTVFEE